MTGNFKRLAPVAPTPDDIAIAREANKRLDVLLAKAAKRTKRKAIDPASAPMLRLATDSPGADGAAEMIPLPASVVRLVVGVIREMAHGNAVAIMPCGDELSTEEAAQILNVSRPFVSKLVDEGMLPARKVGRNRRIRFDDLMAYKKQDDSAREQALADLTAMSQELDMGY